MTSLFRRLESRTLTETRVLTSRGVNYCRIMDLWSRRFDIQLSDRLRSPSVAVFFEES